MANPAARSVALPLAVAAALLLGHAPAGAESTAKPASGSYDIALDEQALRAAGVSFLHVERERGATDLVFPGTVVVPPPQLLVVAAPVEGLIEAVEVASDENVSAGQTIIRMRSPELVTAQRDFIAADANAALARDRLSRAAPLFTARALSERELRIAENEARTTAYKADEARHVLTLLGMTEQEVDTLQRTRNFSPTIAITAPKAGVVLTRQTSPGARVAQAEPLFTIARLDPLWVNVQIPSARLGSVDVGSPVTLVGQGAAGTIIRIGRGVDPATQSVTAVAQIDTNGGSVRPGLAVTVRVRVKQEDAAQWVVPAASVVRHRDQSWVFVRTPGGVRATPVQVLSENARDASIRADLKAGDRIAGRGLIPLLAELAKSDTE
ncbi:MAG: efflux RND transporter periplasmic adaptor subunit [Enhydrobacter sp.]|nr:efflux RND transporter periplasmic adaptor subunit [Enhydrobacter sp.]